MDHGVVVSVVVPAYNAETTIEACLASLGQQTLPRKSYEIIIADDGSTDQTASLATRHDGVRVVCQANAGPAKARNTGAKAAKGQYLVFVDADCEVADDFLRAITAPMEANAEVVGVQGRYRSRQHGLVARFVQIEVEERYALMRRREDIDHIGTYAAAFRRQVFLEHGGFDTVFPEASNEDMEFSYRLVAAGHKLRLAPDAFCHHRHADSLPRYFRAKFRHAYWTAMLYGRHRDKILKDSYRPKSLRFEVLSLVGLPLVAVFAGLVSRSMAPTFLVCLLYLAAFLFAPMIPFTLFALRRDAAAGLIAPLMITARSVAGASGLVVGLLRTGGLSKSKAHRAVPR
ncbi:MAG: glycosyltransferase [Armatimonadota bacterium]|nr:MAG: glycosyltransferase [Armatimonadota bacterium]